MPPPIELTPLVAGSGWMGVAGAAPSIAEIALDPLPAPVDTEAQPCKLAMQTPNDPTSKGVSFIRASFPNELLLIEGPEIPLDQGDWARIADPYASTVRQTIKVSARNHEYDAAHVG
jgi:hypothetical protein